MVLWVFGYGSLIWNPGFDFDEKLIGYIKDYRRVFDLEVPLNILLQLALWSKPVELYAGGAAYCVRGGPEKEKLAMEYLERRECEYDSKTLVEFYIETDASKPIVTGVIIFTSTPDKVSNKYYLGPAPLEEMARQIATATGPCGKNREYLFKLEKAMYDIEHEEEYVIELANEVRKQLGLPEEVKALLKPVVSRVPFKSQAPVPTRKRVCIMKTSKFINQLATLW